MLATDLAYAEFPQESGRNDRLLQLGPLDVTQAPCSADPAGELDATAAIERAVNTARDRGLVCFFPAGTYRICDYERGKPTVDVILEGENR